MKAIKVLFIALALSAAAQFLLEEVLGMYRDDTLRHHPEALEQLQHEAEAGNVDASFLLATAYRNGKAGTVDLAKAYRWYREAAGNGDADAMLVLGWMHYRQTANLEANAREARYWFKKAAALGVDEAIEMLQLLETE